jgi:ABC-type branched-subunit amino acid transport system substrate-binding protein
VGPAASPNKHKTTDVIKIGADLPMSGPNSEYGELLGAAASLAAEHANADKALSKKLVIQLG